jgi:hypothetical protein
MAKQPNMQRQPLSLIHRLLRLSNGLTNDEKVVLIKKLAGEVGDPMYTQSEMEEKLREYTLSRQRAQAVQRDIEEYQALLKSGLR